MRKLRIVEYRWLVQSDKLVGGSMSLKPQLLGSHSRAAALLKCSEI